ncbi:MAG: class I SAM-dependent methyltransferase, partial [Deltaproteobacteria bacterium]
MDKSILVRLIGFPATLIHSDTLVLDRWLWLKSRLPVTLNEEKLLDLGCGSGAFSIGAALRGYSTLGLSWEERNQSVAKTRAKICRAENASFEVQDVRFIDKRTEFNSAFDVVICTENIEHVLDDKKQMEDIYRCLKPGGRLLLTTPYYYYKPISKAGELGPFFKVESGGHVRRGYTKAMLEELCDESGFRIEEISSCSGFLSQKITWLYRQIILIH